MSTAAASNVVPLKAEFDPNNHIIKMEDGSDYLEAKWRIAWFRDKYPIDSGWQLVAENVLDNGEKATAIGRIINPQGVIVAQCSRSIMAKKYSDYREMAETQAIGRALALAGFGTQFAGKEFNENGIPADAPVKQPEVKKGAKTGGNQTEEKAATKDNQQPTKANTTYPTNTFNKKPGNKPENGSKEQQKGVSLENEVGLIASEVEVKKDGNGIPWAKVTFILTNIGNTVNMLAVKENATYLQSLKQGDQLTISGLYFEEGHPNGPKTLLAVKVAAC